MENPYQAPEPKTLIDGVSALIPKPSRVTVFGILHLLVATVGFGGLISNKIGSNNPKTSILQSFRQDKEAPAEFTPEVLGVLDKALSLNLYFEIFSGMSGKAFAEEHGIKYPTFALCRRQRGESQHGPENQDQVDEGFLLAEISPRRDVNDGLTLLLPSGREVRASGPNGGNLLAQLIAKLS